jgi:phenylalanyl-tRNA synthetase alpha chain
VRRLPPPLSSYRPTHICFPLDPVASTGFPQDYYERVKAVHEVGGNGSTGYRYPFSKEETSKLVLRTHTTSVSSAMLYELANQEGDFKPAKMFSIDRVFRNEAVDMTHLAEFHQVEGVIADRNLTLADLIGSSSFPLSLLCSLFL